MKVIKIKTFTECPHFGKCEAWENLSGKQRTYLLISTGSPKSYILKDCHLADDHKEIDGDTIIDLTSVGVLDENEVFKAADQLKKLANLIIKHIPKSAVFAILVFPRDDPSVSNYISNSKKSDMIVAFTELAKRIKDPELITLPRKH